jgi:hypothetical protein
MQGKESKLVIHDWVISAPTRYKMSDLGFIVDDHRGKVDSGHGSHAEQLRLWLTGRVDFR